MTDITTTDNRAAAPAEQARAEENHQAALARVAELEAELARLNSSQIEPNDPRLVPLWNKVRRIADHAGYPEHYDTLAEELGGALRDRTYTATMRTVVEVNLPVEVTEANEEDAIDAAKARVTTASVGAALTANGWTDVSVEEVTLSEH